MSSLSNVFSPIQSFINSLRDIRFPSIPDWLRGGGGGGAPPGNYNGLAYVPYDGYRTVLHQGERVLTAQEAAVYNQIEAALKGATAAMSRAYAAPTMVSRSSTTNRSVTINVGSIDATNPDEGKALLGQLAFFT